MTDALVLGGVRTPVGGYGGSLAHLRVDDLLGQTMVAACERLGVPLDRIEDISAGWVNPAHEGIGDIARAQQVSVATWNLQRSSRFGRKAAL